MFDALGYIFLLDLLIMHMSKSIEAHQDMVEIMNRTEDVMLPQSENTQNPVITDEDYEALNCLKNEQELNFIFERHGDVIESLSDR